MEYTIGYSQESYFNERNGGIISYRSGKIKNQKQQNKIKRRNNSVLKGENLVEGKDAKINQYKKKNKPF